MLDRNSSKTLFAQAKDILLHRIETGEYMVNTKIPSENELCEEFKVSRMTIRGVITELVRDDKLYRIQGKGTFVAEPKITTNSLSYVGIREQLEQQGYEVTTKLISVDVAVTPENIAKAIPEFAGSLVYIIKRLRIVKDVPLSFHTSYIPKEQFDGIENCDLTGEQLCVILSKEFGCVRSSVTETLELVMANEEESKHLKVSNGHPLLLLRNTISDANNRVFEYSVVAFRGDKIRIKMQY